MLKSYDAKALASRIGMAAPTLSKWMKTPPIAAFEEVVVRDVGLRVVLRSGAEIDGLAFESLLRLLREGGI